MGDLLSRMVLPPPALPLLGILQVGSPPSNVICPDLLPSQIKRMQVRSLAYVKATVGLLDVCVAD